MLLHFVPKFRGITHWMATFHPHTPAEGSAVTLLITHWMAVFHPTQTHMQRELL